jgi:hypothetical protein
MLTKKVKELCMVGIFGLVLMGAECKKGTDLCSGLDELKCKNQKDAKCEWAVVKVRESVQMCTGALHCPTQISDDWGWYVHLCESAGCSLDIEHDCVGEPDKT